MSLYIGRENDGKPAIQFTRNPVTQAIMKQGPSEETTFHSALDYMQVYESHIIEQYNNHPYITDNSTYYYYAPQRNDRVQSLINAGYLFSTTTRKHIIYGGVHKLPTDPLEGGVYMVEGDTSLSLGRDLYRSTNDTLKGWLVHSTGINTHFSPYGWRGITPTVGVPGNVSGSLNTALNSTKLFSYNASRGYGSYSYESLLPSGQEDDIRFWSSGYSASHVGSANLEGKIFADLYQQKLVHTSINSAADSVSVGGMVDYSYLAYHRDISTEINYEVPKHVPAYYNPAGLTVGTNKDHLAVEFTQYIFYNVKVDSTYPFARHVQDTPAALELPGEVFIDKHDLVVGGDFSFKSRTYVMELPRVSSDPDYNVFEAQYNSTQTHLESSVPIWAYMNSLFPVGEPFRQENFDLPHLANIQVVLDSGKLVKYWSVTNSEGMLWAFSPDTSFPGGGLELTNDSLRYENKATGAGVDVVGPLGGMLRIQGQPTIVTAPAESLYFSDIKNRAYRYIEGNVTNSSDVTKTWFVSEVIGTAQLPPDALNTTYLGYSIESSCPEGTLAVTRAGTTTSSTLTLRKLGAPLNMRMELKPEPGEDGVTRFGANWISNTIYDYELNASNLTGYDRVETGKSNSSTSNKAQAIRVTVGTRLNWLTGQLEVVRNIVGASSNVTYYTYRGDGTRTHRIFSYGDTEVRYDLPSVEVSLQVLSTTRHFEDRPWWD